MKLISSLFAAVSTMGNSSYTSWLRIIQINDVYELDNFPSLKTLVDQYRSTDADKCIMVCAGDFLAPSLLSSLDQGRGMVDLLNTVGCDYVCLGNHENDVGDDALRDRIVQSNFCWINSNIPDFKEKMHLEKDTPEHVVLKVRDKNIALVGLLTDDPSLYRPGAFGGSTIQPIEESLQTLRKKLGDVDMILPLTHQGIDKDRELAKSLKGSNIPLLMGGHDHELYLEDYDGCKIVKTGMDAQQVAVIDIKCTSQSKVPSVSVEVLETTDFAPDTAVLQRVKEHHSVLRELDSARLFMVDDWIDDTESSQSLFSTNNNRLGPSTGTTALCSMLRMGLRCEVALVNAGAVRAGKVYDSGEVFTWSDLKAEMPFATKLVVCSIPGRIIQEMIQYSRQWANHGTAKGGYIHTSRTTVCDPESNTIQTILGKDFNPDRDYLTALPFDFFEGIDNHQPLLDWAKTKDEADLPNGHIATPSKYVLVQVFSALIWLRLGNFSDVAGSDGSISKEDVRQRLREVYGVENDAVANLMLDNVFSVADIDRNGSISAMEQMVVRFAATDMLNHVVTADEMKVLSHVASQVLGKDPSSEEVNAMVLKIKEALDRRGSGSIQRDELLEALGDLSGKHLLQ